MDDETRSRLMQSWRRRAMPMPDLQAVLPFERTFSPQEWQEIVKGVVPTQMEDKWLIYTEGDVIFFHRSWTRACIYQVSVEKVSGDYPVGEVLVNRDEAQYRASDMDYEAALLNFLIDALLLGKSSAKFPMPKDSVQDGPPGLFQHHISGTGLQEEQISDGSANE